METESSNLEQQFATFHVGNLLFGIPVHRVQEVVRQQEITPVQLCSSIIAGLINLRGQILTAIDLRTRLSMTEKESGTQMNVIVRSKEGAVSLLVDAIGDVLEVDGDSFEEPSDTLTGPCRDVVRAVCKLENSLLLIMDVEKAVVL